MEYVEFVRANWPDVATVITVLSFIATVFSFVSQSHANKRLEIAHFQFRELFLHIGRNRARIEANGDVSVNEAIALLDGYEGMAAAGMHGIQPHSVDADFPTLRKIYLLLVRVKKGINILRGK
ncbi:MAG: hypothetical protein FJ245_12180 [Nitrospira sp.]|nr:hypothetical protein [Nitrospira sp.]